MIDESFERDGDRFKAAVRMRRKAWDALSVVHPKTVFWLKVLTDGSALKMFRIEPELGISCGVEVLVVGAKQEGIDRGPLKAQGLLCDEGRGKGHLINCFLRNEHHANWFWSAWACRLEIP